MSEMLLNKILEEILNLNKRIDHLKWLIMDLKTPILDPTPNEQIIIDKYEKDKENGVLEFSEFI